MSLKGVSLRFIGVFAMCTMDAASGSLLAADSPNEQLAMTTQRAVIFKDGYYLAIKHATAVTNKDGELHLDDVPDMAVLGTVWATSTKGKLISITSSKETVKKTIERETPCLQTADVLQVNVGKEALIVLQDKTEYRGTIRSVLGEPTAAMPSVPLFDLFRPGKDAQGKGLAGLSSSAILAGPASATVTQLNGSQVILRTEDGDVLLPIAQIRTLTVKEMKSTMPRVLTTTETPKRMTFRFAEPNLPVDLSLMYFRPGLRWIPTYRVTLPAEDQKKIANLAMQAEFLNEAEDLEDVPVDIVVGVPNFRFKDAPSPLVLEAAMRNALQQAAPALMGQQMIMSNSFAARAGERQGRPGGNADDAGVLNLPAELGAGGAQDLFIYSLPKLKLAKGQRAALSIFTADVPYRDVYTWDVHLTRHDLEGSPAKLDGKSPLQFSENRVWHQIVLSNNTKVPWTTGAAMVVQGLQPLSQDLLTYTSPGGETRLPITVSVDTSGTFDDEETGRKLNDLQWNNMHYARIDKSATMRLTNRKKIPIDVEIMFRTGGKADEATEDGKVILRPFTSADWTEYHGSPSVNNSSLVQWKSTVKPGASFSPNAKYHYYSRQ